MQATVARGWASAPRLTVIEALLSVLLGAGGTAWLWLADCRRPAVTGSLRWDRLELLAIALASLVFLALGREVGRTHRGRLTGAVALVVAASLGYLAEAIQPAQWSALPLGVVLPVAVPVAVAAWFAGICLTGVGRAAPLLLACGAVGSAVAVGSLDFAGRAGLPRLVLLAGAALCLVGAASLVTTTTSVGRKASPVGGWSLSALAGVLATVLVAQHWPGSPSSVLVLLPGVLGFALGSAASNWVGPSQRPPVAVLIAGLAYLAYQSSPVWWSSAVMGLGLGGLLGSATAGGVRHRAIAGATLSVGLSAMLLALGAGPAWLVGGAVVLAVLGQHERTWIAMPVAIGVVVMVGMAAIWPAHEPSVPLQQVVQRAGGLQVVYGERHQELALRAGSVDLDLAGPAHEHGAMMAGVAASLTPRSARMLVIGVGRGRLDAALSRCGRTAALRLAPLASCAGEALGAAMCRDGPLVDPAAVGGAVPPVGLPDASGSGREWAGARRDGLFRILPGAVDVVVCAEPLLGGQPWRASLAEQRAMRRVAGDGWVIQCFLMDRTPPELVAAALATGSAVHPWTGVLLSGNVGLILSGAAEPDWSEAASRLDALPEGARWLLHAAGLGGGVDLELSFLGRWPRGKVAEGQLAVEPWLPVSNLRGRATTAQNARQLLVALGAGLSSSAAADRVRLRAGAGGPVEQRQEILVRLTGQLLVEPESLLLWRECAEARLDLAVDQVAATDSDDPAAVAAAAALAASFAHLGAPRATLQAALGLPDLRGQRLRSPGVAASVALAMEPGFAVTAPAVVQPLLGAALADAPLGHFAELPSGSRLASLASGNGPLAIALRARFSSRCAAALVEQWGRGPLPSEQRAALRELVDPFVLAAAGLVLDARGARSELLQVFRRDLPGSGPLRPLAAGAPTVRAALMVALAGRKDLQSLEVLAEGLVDSDLAVRTAAGAALFRSVGGSIDYDPEWPAARRNQAAARVRALQNRTQ